MHDITHDRYTLSQTHTFLDPSSGAWRSLSTWLMDFISLLALPQNGRIVRTCLDYCRASLPITYVRYWTSHETHSLYGTVLCKDGSFHTINIGLQPVPGWNLCRVFIGVDFGWAARAPPRRLFENRPCIYHFLPHSAPNIWVCPSYIFDKFTPVIVFVEGISTICPLPAGQCFDRTHQRAARSV